jgi:magnesium chelatase family protein
VGYRSVFVPQADAPEAALIEGIDVYPVQTVGAVAAHLRDYHPIEPYRAVWPSTPTRSPTRQTCAI